MKSLSILHKNLVEQLPNTKSRLKCVAIVQKFNLLSPHEKLISNVPTGFNCMKIVPSITFLVIVAIFEDLDDSLETTSNFRWHYGTYNDNGNSTGTAQNDNEQFSTQKAAACRQLHEKDGTWST